MKHLAAITVLCGLGSVASGWGIYMNAGTMRGAAAESSEIVAEAAAPAGLCIYNFSKNDCQGVVEPGHVESIGCDDQGCRTIRVTEAVYKTTLKSSGLGCGQTCEGSCDEFPDGTLTLKFNYVLRADSCCPYRGSWEGNWEFVTDAGRRFAGSANGTIGVGTNRKSDCLVTNDDCEPCADVELRDNLWLIGIEGSFRGKSLINPTPVADELNFTSDGTWLVNAHSAGPFNEPFRVHNRMDGSFLDYCQ